MIIVQKYKRFIYLLICFFIFFSCNTSERNKIKNIDADIKIIRFDLEQNKLDELHYYEQIAVLAEKYPFLMEALVEHIARAGSVRDTSYRTKLKPVIFDKYTQKLYEKVATSFPDFDSYEHKIEDAFRYILFYFPDTELPDIYTLVSNFAMSTATYENILLISLDMYLGSDYQYYEGLFPKYKYSYFTVNQIVPDVVRVWFSNIYPEDSFEGKTLLSKMIYYGKMNLFVEKIIPGLQDSVIMQYTHEQIKFAEKYRKELWQSIIDSKMLFETDILKTGRYIDEAPFTNAYNIPQQCPPRIGRYFGWQIIKNYMKRNPELSLKDILSEKDENKILLGYKP